MVTFIPARNEWNNAFRNIGEGLVEGYTNASDERALQEAIHKLPKDASPREHLNALMGVRTYDNAAKQQAIKNFMGVAEFEEAQRTKQEARKKEAEKMEREKMDALTLIDNADHIDALGKQDMREKVERGELSYRGAKALTKPPKSPNESQAPINDEQLSKIQKVRNSEGYNEASPAKKYQMLTDAGVSRSNAKAEADIYTEENKAEAAKLEARTKEEREFHKDTAKFDDQLETDAKHAQEQLDAIEEIMPGIESGKIKPTSLANVFRNFGAIGEAISEAFLNEDESKLGNLLPNFLAGRKELFGVRLSDADLKLLKDKLPSIGKSKEANIAILKLMKKYSERTILKAHIGREIKRENGDIRPKGYRDKVNERFDKMIKPVKVKSPTGEIVTVPTYKLEQAIKDGGSLVHE